MSLLFWGVTLGFLGKIILGVAVLRVHSGILHEHKIDGAVLRVMRREQYITFLGLALIIVGYILELVFYDFNLLLHCNWEECAAATSAAFEALR